MALLPDPLVNPQIREQDVTVKPEMPAQYTDDAALSILKQDHARAKAWMEANKWKQAWRENDVLYQSPNYGLWGISGMASRSTVSRFTVLQHVNSLGPGVAEAIFSDPRPFVATPRPNTSSEVVRAKSDLIAALLDEIEFEKTCKVGIDQCALQGTQLFKFGWEKKTIKRKRKKRKTPETTQALPLQKNPVKVPTAEADEFEDVEEEITVNRPWFEARDLGTVIPAPGWKSPNEIRKAPYVIEEIPMTLEEIDALRDQDGYDIPPLETLKSYFIGENTTSASAPSSVLTDQASESGIVHAMRPDQEQSVDPMLKVLMVIERHTKTKITVAIEDRVLIRNGDQDAHGIPYLGFNWFNLSRTGWGIGAGRIAGGDQRIGQGSINVALDLLSFAANQTYIASRGSNPSTQDIRMRLGGMIKVDGPAKDAFHILESPKVPPELWAVIQNAEKSSESADGADSAFTQGTMPGKGSSIGRTATGAGGIAAASAGRLQGPVGRFVDYVLIPYLYILEGQVRDNMPPSELRAILAEEYDAQFEGDMESLLNSRLRWDCLAGAHLAAKKAMAQSLPLIMQVFENPQLVSQLAQIGWKVDVKELFDMIMEVSGWKNTRDIIKPMTDQEKQAYTQNNPATAGLQSKLQLEQAKTQGKIAVEDQRTQGKIAEKLVDKSTDRAEKFAEREGDEQDDNAVFSGETQ